MLSGTSGTPPGRLGGPQLSPSGPKSTPKTSGPSFEEVLNQATPKSFGLNIHAELLRVERAVASGQGLPLPDLINLQIKAGQFGLRVELLSKVAESATTTLRKLQSGQ